MKHKSIVEKYNTERLPEGSTFLKIDWKKKRIHFLSSGNNKKTESLIVPKIVEK